MFFNEFANLRPIFTIDISIVHVFLIIFTFMFNICFLFFQDVLIIYLDELIMTYYEKVHFNFDREEYENLSKLY